MWRDERGSNEEETDGAKLQQEHSWNLCNTSFLLHVYIEEEVVVVLEGRAVLVNHALTVGLGQLRQAVVLLVRDEVGQPSEEAAAQLTLEDGVHLPEQHVLQLAGACQEGKEREERSERASERVSAVPGARAAKVFFLWPPSDV